MEKENKEITENIEQKEDDSVKNSEKNKKRFGRIKTYIKKHPYRILAVILLCIVLFFVLRETGIISKHVYEEVENLGEREGVCFDNLLFLYKIVLSNNDGKEWEYKYLCIFNTGDIYCFDWSESYWWYNYYEDSDNGYDDTNWEKAENVVYLGRLSNRDISCLNQYVKDFVFYRGKYFMSGVEEEPDGIGENQQNQVLLNNQQEWRYYNINIFQNNQRDWRSYEVCLFPYNQQGESKGIYEVIESCGMNHLSGGIYEKGELWRKSYEENALAALRLFESSMFYYRWIHMCLNNG